MKSSFFIITFLLIVLGNISILGQRREINLNGTWEISKTNTKSGIPVKFSSKIQVPGLVDMAIPAIDTVPSFKDRSLDLTVAATNSISESAKKALDSLTRNVSWYYNDVVYWYKRKINVERNADNIFIKINKSMYHTKIYLNGKFAGENFYSFTPTIIDIKPFINQSTSENELVISVGSRNNLPTNVVRGDDYEKFFFIPGIYDDVKLILTGFPYLSNVQTVSDIKKQELRVVAEIIPGNNDKINLSYIVRETISRKVVAKGILNQFKSKNPDDTKIDFNIPIPNCKLWSPEIPFQYDLELNTGGDCRVTRFGLRSFSTSSDNNVVLLNGKTYYMRGTNICLFRFFEDTERGNLPWNNKWVTDLHQSFKNMNWNSYRPTLGFPPERWYEIADSLGFLIQDEYPIWGGHKPKVDNITAELLASEYKAWMRERWNHASVVIWDAQNESVYDTTAIAINKVRALDLSNRPWDNGWATPASKSDIMESHPYLLYPFYNQLKNHKKFEIKDGLLKELFSKNPIPDGPNFKQETDKNGNKHPIIINEYGWLWLNRDGSPTILSDLVYANFFPLANTPEKRFEAYAKLLGIETEYWRSIRKCAGIMNFCALTYSHSTPPRGMTCDNFIDVKDLKYEPYFFKYVRPAFSPVGIMINLWYEKLKSNSNIDIPLNLINDTDKKWNGVIKVTLKNSVGIVNIQTKRSELKPLEKKRYTFSLKLPNDQGSYKLEAEIIYNGESVKSLREFVLE